MSLVCHSLDSCKIYTAPAKLGKIMVSRRLNSTNKLTQKISPRNSSSDKYFVTHPPTQILSRPRFWLPKSSDIEPTEILPRRFAQSLPRRPNPRSPHFKGPRFSRWCGGELFASRLRQPCGGEGSEGRALAIPRASGAGWADRVGVRRAFRRAGWHRNLRRCVPEGRPRAAWCRDP